MSYNSRLTWANLRPRVFFCFSSCNSIARLSSARFQQHTKIAAEKFACRDGRSMSNLSSKKCEEREQATTAKKRQQQQANIPSGKEFTMLVAWSLITRYECCSVVAGWAQAHVQQRHGRSGTSASSWVCVKETESEWDYNNWIQAAPEPLAINIYLMIDK